MRGWLGLLVVGCAKGVGDGTDPEAVAPDPDTDDTAPIVEDSPVVVTACPDGADHATAQAAVDAAPDGAIVALCGATFPERIVLVDRELTLRGAPGAVLDGGGIARALEVTGGAEARVETLTITDGWGEWGGGVWCEAASLTLVDVTLTGNLAQTGGGIGARGCTVSMTRVELTANEAWGAGGGGLVDGGELTIADSRIAGNFGADGGGLLVRGAIGALRDSVIEDNVGHVGGGIWLSGSFSLIGNVFRGNTALYTGGGFGSVDGTGDISENEVHDNRSVEDGGGGFTQSHTGRVEYNDFHDNVATEDAGALRMLYGAATVQHNSFRGNMADGGAGGAMKVSHAGCDMHDNLFEANVASFGGALEIDDDISRISHNTFRGNYASHEGGAVHLNEPYYDIELDTLVLDGNVAGGCGGAIAMDDDGLDEVPEDRFTANISRIVATNNRAESGGAVCILQGGLILTNSVLAGNTADGEGGAVFVDGADARLTNVTLHDNTGDDALSFGLIGLATVTDSIVSSGDGVSGTPTWRYNLSEGDPMFVDADGGDFHLVTGSPAIDAGDPTRMDADGTRMDMGAYGGPNGDW